MRELTPADDARILALRDEHKLGFKAIGERLGVGQSTAAAAYGRARRAAGAPLPKTGHGKPRDGVRAQP